MSHTGQQRQQLREKERRRTRPRRSTRTSTTYDTSNKTNNSSNTQQQHGKQHSTKTIKTSKGRGGGEAATVRLGTLRSGLACSALFWSGVSCLALLPCWLRCSNAGFFFGCLRFHASKAPLYTPLDSLPASLLLPPSPCRYPFPIPIAASASASASALAWALCSAVFLHPFLFPFPLPRVTCTTHAKIWSDLFTFCHCHLPSPSQRSIRTLVRVLLLPCPIALRSRQMLCSNKFWHIDIKSS